MGGTRMLGATDLINPWRQPWARYVNGGRSGTEFGTLN